MASKKVSTRIPEDLIASYDKIIAAVPDVERKGAAMPYTSVNGNMFSFLTAGGKLALRLSEKDRNEFIAKYNTSLVEAHGTVLKEYVAVPDDLFVNTAKMKKYFRTSYEYTSTLKHKKTTAVKTKKHHPDNL